MAAQWGSAVLVEAGGKGERARSNTATVHWLIIASGAYWPAYAAASASASAMVQAQQMVMDNLGLATAVALTYLCRHPGVALPFCT